MVPMAKNLLANRKRTSELSKVGKAVTEEKKDELLAIRLQQMNQKAESAGQLKDIVLNELLPDPNQPRKIFKNIDMLAQSIQEKGIIQPIIVTPKKADGFYHIIAGERRFRAAKQAKLSVIPCILRDESDDSDILILQLLENEQREKVSPFEEADALVELISKKKNSKTQIAQSLGRDPSWISMRLRISKSSSVIRHLANDGYIEDVRTLYELKKLEDELPQAANEFVTKVRQNKVHGAYRQAIKRSKEVWLKKQELIENPHKYIDINEVLFLDDGVLGFKSTSDKSNHVYQFKLSKTALSQLKELF